MSSPGSSEEACNSVRPSMPAATSRTIANAISDRKSTRLNSSHGYISYAVFCLKKKKFNNTSRNFNIVHDNLAGYILTAGINNINNCNHVVPVSTNKSSISKQECKSNMHLAAV